MSTIEILRINLLSPLVLSFGLGVFAKTIKSELALPKDLYNSLSIYLLFALGLKGGVELSESSFSAIAMPVGATLLLGVITPIVAYMVLRQLGRFSISDSAGLAAHYGSVSAVTFISAQQFTAAVGSPAEGFMPTLLTLLETPGIQIALAIGVLRLRKSKARNGTELTGSAGGALREVLTARSMVLLVGGLLIGFLIGEGGYAPVKGFFEGGFKGALTLFLLEMGLVAGTRLGDLKKVGGFLVGFGILVPLFHGCLGVLLGHFAGLSVGGMTVFGAMAASASYIAAPPAVRMTLPEANPTYYLTSSLAITLPFNLVAGIPIYYKFATLISG